MTLEEQISALSEEYRDHIRPELEVLRMHISNLRLGVHSEEERLALQRMAHMQSGSAGSFGFDQLADKARATDQIIHHGRTGSELLAALEAWDVAFSEALC